MVQAQTHLTLGKKGTLNCDIGTDVCGMNVANKSTQNAQLTYQPKTRELLITLDKQTLGQENTDKLLSEQRTKGKMQYRFTYNNPLSPDVIQQLGLKGKVFIKKGIYPVVETNDAYLLRVKLVFE